MYLERIASLNRSYHEIYYEDMQQNLENSVTVRQFVTPLICVLLFIVYNIDGFYLYYQL